MGEVQKQTARKGLTFWRVVGKANLYIFEGGEPLFNHCYDTNVAQSD